MKTLGLLFIGMALFALVVVLFFAPDVPMESAYGFTYTWSSVLIIFGLSAGVALLLADWNVYRENKRKTKN